MLLVSSVDYALSLHNPYKLLQTKYNYDNDTTQP